MYPNYFADNENLLLHTKRLSASNILHIENEWKTMENNWAAFVWTSQ